MLWIIKKTLQNHVIVKRRTLNWPSIDWLHFFLELHKCGNTEHKLSWKMSWRVSQQPNDSGAPARGKKAKLILSLVMKITILLLLPEGFLTQPDLLYWEHTHKVVPLIIIWNNLERWSRMVMNGMVSKSIWQIWEIWSFSAPFPWGKHSYG